VEVPAGSLRLKVTPAGRLEEFCPTCRREDSTKIEAPKESEVVYRRPVRRTVVEDDTGPNVIFIVLAVLVAVVLIWVLFVRGGLLAPDTEDRRETPVQEQEDEADAPDINIQIPTAPEGNEGGGNEGTGNQGSGEN
jgi:hypothetical protein